jgi:antitoxin VapB
MAFHVRDPRAEALVREIARRRGLGITATIREVFEEVVAADRDRVRSRGEELLARLGPLLDRVAAIPKTGSVVDKRLFDAMWRQGDD